MKQDTWLSRDDTGDAWYGIDRGEPDKRDGGEFHSDGGNIAIFLPSFFHKYVEGARLRKGRKKRIKRILIELED